MEQIGEIDDIDVFYISAKDAADIPARFERKHDRVRSELSQDYNNNTLQGNMLIAVLCCTHA